MNLEEKICSVVRSELNHIYTEPPFYAHGGSDLGWFCREHAIHLFSLAWIMGLPAQVVLGDFVIVLPDGKKVSSLNDDSDHAWCRIGNTEPVDVSATTRFLDQNNKEMGAVWGIKTTSGGYSVSQIKEKGIKKKLNTDSPQMIYIKRKELAFDPIDLQSNPYQFLFNPPSGCPKFTQVHNEDVFFQITWHCFRLLLGDAKPFHTYRTSKDTVKGMIKFNPNAKQNYVSQINKQSSRR